MLGIREKFENNTGSKPLWALSQLSLWCCVIVLVYNTAAGLYIMFVGRENELERQPKVLGSIPLTNRD